MINQASSEALHHALDRMRAGASLVSWRGSPPRRGGGAAFTGGTGAVRAYVCRPGCPRSFGGGVCDRRPGRGDPHAEVVAEDPQIVDWISGLPGPVAVSY